MAAGFSLKNRVKVMVFETEGDFAPVGIPAGLFEGTIIAQQE
jgi:hypothetical protein